MCVLASTTLVSLREREAQHSRLVFGTRLWLSRTRKSLARICKLASERHCVIPVFTGGSWVCDLITSDHNIITVDTTDNV